MGAFEGYGAAVPVSIADMSWHRVGAAAMARTTPLPSWLMRGRDDITDAARMHDTTHVP